MPDDFASVARRALVRHTGAICLAYERQLREQLAAAIARADSAEAALGSGGRA